MLCAALCTQGLNDSGAMDVRDVPIILAEQRWDVVCGIEGNATSCQQTRGASPGAEQMHAEAGGVRRADTRHFGEDTW